VISAQQKAYDDITDRVEKFENEVNSAYPRHPFIHVKRLNKAVKQLKDTVTKELGESKKQHRDFLMDDDMRTKLDSIFEGRVGQPYDEEQLKKNIAAAERRYQNKVPPGYRDEKKPTPAKFGDAILWFQIKDYASNSKRNIVLVTDDRKEDWWRQHEGKTLGPQPELIQEMKRDCGVLFYMYESDRFISYSQTYLKLKDQQAVDEATLVKELQRSVELQEAWEDLKRSSVSAKEIRRGKDLAKWRFFDAVFDSLRAHTEGATIGQIALEQQLPERIVRSMLTDLSKFGITSLATSPGGEEIYRIPTDILQALTDLEG
jgi:hypothetical protein